MTHENTNTALLVMDVQRKTYEAKKLADRVRARNLPLSTILISHGHTDHFTGMDLFHREFHNDLEVGDRLRLGPVELIVRDIDDGVIGSLGLSLDPPAKPLAGWERWKMTIDKIFG